MNNLILQVANFATASTTNIWALAGNFLVLVILTALMIGFSYRSGRAGIISLLVAFYIGYCIYSIFPYTDTIVNLTNTPLIKAGLSISLFILATVIPFIFIQRLTGGGIGVLSFIPRFVLSFLAACFLLALAYHVFDLTHIYTFPKSMNSIFGPNQYFFWWFIAPLIGLFFLVH